MRLRIWKNLKITWTKSLRNRIYKTTSYFTTQFMTRCWRTQRKSATPFLKHQHRYRLLIIALWSSKFTNIFIRRKKSRFKQKSNYCILLCSFSSLKTCANKAKKPTTVKTLRNNIVNNTLHGTDIFI